MDFGATVCKPVSPLCFGCVFRKSCSAFINNKVNELPLKKKKISIRKRWFYYLILEHKNEIAIRQRTEKDIWQDLFEFPLIETSNECDLKIILQEAEKKKWLLKNEYEVLSVSKKYKQQLSHHLIAGRFIMICLKKKVQPGIDKLWVIKKRLGKYAFPQFINQYLRDKTGKLRLF
jgi:A/G-specific adenine glycosylase